MDTGLPPSCLCLAADDFGVRYSSGLDGRAVLSTDGLGVRGTREGFGVDCSEGRWVCAAEDREERFLRSLLSYG